MPSRCRDVALAEIALRAFARQQAHRRIGQVFAQSRIDSIGVEGSALRRARWRHVIVVAAVLVISQEHDSVLPVRAISYRVDDLRDNILTRPDIEWRVFVGLVTFPLITWSGANEGSIIDTCGSVPLAASCMKLLPPNGFGVEACGYARPEMECGCRGRSPRWGDPRSS